VTGAVLQLTAELDARAAVEAAAEVLLSRVRYGNDEV
jgi:hypothetical protein